MNSHYSWTREGKCERVQPSIDADLSNHDRTWSATHLDFCAERPAFGRPIHQTPKHMHHYYLCARLRRILCEVSIQSASSLPHVVGIQATFNNLEALSLVHSTQVGSKLGDRHRLYQPDFAGLKLTPEYVIRARRSGSSMPDSQLTRCEMRCGSEGRRWISYGGELGALTYVGKKRLIADK